MSMNWLRHLVSKKKRRFQQDGFDLDLAYITPNIIAMGYPSTGVEGLYRNKRSHSVAFLQLRHGDAFRVYNLCSERHYPLDVFGPGDVVAEYPFDDHNPSPMWMMVEFVADALTFLEASDEHVVAIHCKAGKGRTGLFICALLLALGKQPTASAVMEFYGEERTKDGKGVTIPSQQRYIQYYATVLDEAGLRDPVPVELAGIAMYGPIPQFGSGGVVGSVKVYSGDDLVAVSDPSGRFTAVGTLTRDGAVVTPLVGPDGGAAVVSGDIKVVLFHTRKFRGPKKIAQFWFHSSYLPTTGELVLSREAIDKANKSSKFAEQFHLVLQYDAGPLKAASSPRKRSRGRQGTGGPLQAADSPLAPRALSTRAHASHTPIVEDANDDDDATMYTYSYEYDWGSSDWSS